MSPKTQLIWETKQKINDLFKNFYLREGEMGIKKQELQSLQGQALWYKFTA